MSFAEVLPLAQSMTRDDQVRLINVLVSELAGLRYETETADELLVPGASYPVWTPLGNEAIALKLMALSEQEGRE